MIDDPDTVVLDTADSNLYMYSRAESCKRSSDPDPLHCPLSLLAGESSVVSPAVVPEWLPSHVLESLRLDPLDLELAE